MRGGARRFAYKLARQLGYLDVDAMLKSIPAWKFFEWRAFYDLEPDGDERNDWGLAHIVQSIILNGKPLKDFMLPFGDAQIQAPTVQPLAYQEMLIDAWILGSNALLNKKAGR